MNTRILYRSLLIFALLLPLLVAPMVAAQHGHGHGGHGGEDAVNIPTLTSPEDPLATVRGDYVEARTSDVWTGPCFANGEVNLDGQEAILAWRVSEGTWDGVDLAGLSVAAVVIANATLGDPHAEPLPARSMLLIDETASESQRAALVSLAHHLGGELLNQVVSQRAVPIAFEVDGAAARLAVGEASLGSEVARLETRPLGVHDTHCGNEFIYYPPLTDTVEATPAATLVHTFHGDAVSGDGTAGALGKTWSSPDKRSAFVGRFAV